MERAGSVKKKRVWLHIFGLSLLAIAHFWVNYFAYRRLNTPTPFNAFLVEYSFVGAHAVESQVAAILAGALASFANRLWLLIALAAFGTIVFLYSQVT